MITKTKDDIKVLEKFKSLEYEYQVTNRATSFNEKLIEKYKKLIVNTAYLMINKKISNTTSS